MLFIFKRPAAVIFAISSAPSSMNFLSLLFPLQRTLLHDINETTQKEGNK